KQLIARSVAARPALGYPSDEQREWRAALPKKRERMRSQARVAGMVVIASLALSVSAQPQSPPIFSTTKVTGTKNGYLFRHVRHPRRLWWSRMRWSKRPGPSHWPARASN